MKVELSQLAKTKIKRIPSSICISGQQGIILNVSISQISHGIYLYPPSVFLIDPKFKLKWEPLFSLEELSLGETEEVSWKISRRRWQCCGKGSAKVLWGGALSFPSPTTCTCAVANVLDCTYRELEVGVECHIRKDGEHGCSPFVEKMLGKITRTLFY